MGAIIRRAELADAEALGALHSACWGELYPKTLTPQVLAQLNPGMMEHLWQKFVAKGDPYKQWVAEVDGEVVGFVGTGPGRERGHDNETELYFLYVAPGHRRSGIGHDLVEATEAEYLWVWEGLKSTRAFYSRHQFVPEIVRGTRGRGPNSRAGAMFGWYFTELKMVRELSTSHA